jgi:translation initiation factor 3 subunit I
MFNKENINIKQFRGQGFMTVSKFNSNGELLFIADKDSKYISLISTSDNKIIGTYDGHNGVIWSLDMTLDTKYMLSCSGDMSCILWNVENGEIITRINETGIPKYVSINNNNLVAIACDPISKRSKSYIKIYTLNDLLNNETEKHIQIFEEKTMRATTVNWLSDEDIIVSYDDGTIKKINYKKKEIIQELKIHEDAIKFVFLTKTKKEILTSSIDKQTKLMDVETLKTNKTFKSTVPINCAVLTPNEDYVLLGGGIEAMMVAKTCDNDLTTKIYQVSNEKLIKEIKNHFGPIRYIDYNSKNESFVTASQDGTAKIHYLKPITNINSNYETFGQVVFKNEDEIKLNNETVKIEEPETKKNTQNQTDKNKIKIKQNQIYPIGHELYKKEEKISDFKINVKINSEKKENSSIKVSNLPSDVELSDLWDIFEFYGRIEENGIKIKKFFNDTVAFINFSTHESAQKAIEKCNKMKIGFCIISVEMCHAK